MRISRIDLHCMVWKKPIKHLATDLDVSPNSITDACIKLDIPKPESGYWSKAKHIDKLSTPLLPTKTPSTPDYFDFTSYIQDRQVRDDLESNLSKLDLASTQHSTHPLVKIGKLAFNKTNHDRRNRLVANQDDHLDLKVSKHSFNHSISIMSMLFYMFDELNWPINLITKNSSSMSVKINDINISFFLKEKVTQEQYTLTDKEQKKRDRGEYVYSGRFSFIPTGELYLHTGNSMNESRKVEIKGIALEDIKHTLIQFCSSLIPASRRKAIESRRREEWHRQYELKLKQETAIRAENTRRQAKLLKLEDDTEKWHKAERIREFIAAKVKASNHSEGVVKWSKWAYEYTDSIDPINKLSNYQQE